MPSRRYEPRPIRSEDGQFDAADVSWISKFPHEHERLKGSDALLEVEGVEDAKDGVERVRVKAKAQDVPDVVYERYVKLSDNDSVMRAIRADPEIQRYEAWIRDLEGRPFETDLKKTADIHRRYRNRQADLFEMVARDEDLEHESHAPPQKKRRLD